MNMVRPPVIMPGTDRTEDVQRKSRGTFTRRHGYHRVVLLVATILMVLQPLPIVEADILVYQMLNDQIIEEFRDLPATFGGEIPDSGLKVLADKADPPDGCTEMRPAPNGTTKFAVVVARYNCSFEVKIRNAQQAGYAMVIVHNVGSNDLEHMSANHPEDLLIPSVFVGESSGRSIIEAYLYDRDYALVITDDIPFNISNNLIIPFAIVVGLCFIIMVLFMIVRCIRERRRRLRHRLPARVLRRIGIVKFAKGMTYETCAICLDDFVENERLRVLPCRHAYHAICVDPWLTKNKRVCPICKRRVVVRGEQRTRRYSSDSSSSNMDESTPLLNGQNGPASNAPVVVAPPPTSSSPSPASPAEGVVPMVTGPEPTAASTEAAGAPQQGRSLLRLLLTESAVQQNSNREYSHMVNMLPSDDDDELLDDRNVPSARWLLQNQQQQQQSQQQQQPVQHETRERASRFDFLQRLFKRTSAQADEQPETGNVPEPPSASSAPSASDPSGTNGGMPPPFEVGTGNNILNAHLSGSFHGSEDTTDDELLGAMLRDRTRHRQFRSAPDMPSTSAGARLGVAALPNINFFVATGGDGDGRGPTATTDRHVQRASRHNHRIRRADNDNNDDSHIV